MKRVFCVRPMLQNPIFKMQKSDKTIGKVINAASNFEISIKETANLIAEIMVRDVEIKADNERIRPKGSEVERLFGDNTLIKSLTNWEPIYKGIDGFKKGLKITVDWFMDQMLISDWIDFFVTNFVLSSYEFSHDFVVPISKSTGPCSAGSARSTPSFGIPHSQS